MKEYSASINIDASPEKIWSILIDGESYPQWDPNAERIEGTIAPGQKIKAFTKLSPGRAFPVKITKFEPGQQMVWTGGMPLGLFKGERTFTLSLQDNGITNFSVKETFQGLLFPLIKGTIPDLTKPFEQFAEGLKMRSEGLG